MDDSNLTLFQFKKKLVDRLATKFGNGEANAMVRIIFENLKGWSPVDMAVKANEILSQYLVDEAEKVVERLLKDEPIQYIFGNAVFYGIKLKVTPATLIPRQETEELVEMIVNRHSNDKDLHVLDIGTGSGCIAIALSRNLQFPSVDAIDISADALAVAKENAKNLHSEINFSQVDILKAIPSPATYDIIVSNPPYIAESEKKEIEPNVLCHEPASALFVPDDDPLKFYRAILNYASVALCKDGEIYFEINPLFSESLMALAQESGFRDIEISLDMFGKKRFLSAKRPAD